MKKLSACLLFLVFVNCSHSPMRDPAREFARNNPPKRLVLVAFDQLRSDSIDAFNLPNFRQLRERGLWFYNAYVGHLSAHPQTSLSVIQSGKLPKNLPWQDIVVSSGSRKTRSLKRTSTLTQKQMRQLIWPNQKDTSLMERLLEVSSGPSFTLSPERHTAYALGLPYSDSIISQKRRSLSGTLIPKYIPQPGLESPMEWVTQSFQKILEEQPDWSTLLITFADTNVTMTPQQADETLGTIWQALEEKQLLEETALVVTALRGQQPLVQFHGDENLDKEGLGLIYGKGDNFEYPNTLSGLSRLFNTGWIQASAHGSVLRFWLNTDNPQAITKFSLSARRIPGALAIYKKTLKNRRAQYLLTRRLGGKRNEWEETFHPELIRTLSAENGPEVIIFLKPGHSYSRLSGDGGASEWTQRIPLLLYSPNLPEQGRDSDTPVRLVDLNPIISKLFNLRIPDGLDGTFEPILRFLNPPTLANSANLAIESD